MLIIEFCFLLEKNLKLNVIKELLAHSTREELGGDSYRRINKARAQNRLSLAKFRAASWLSSNFVATQVLRKIAQCPRNRRHFPHFFCCGNHCEK